MKGLVAGTPLVKYWQKGSLYQNPLAPRRQGIGIKSRIGSGNILKDVENKKDPPRGRTEHGLVYNAG